MKLFFYIKLFILFLLIFYLISCSPNLKKYSLEKTELQLIDVEVTWLENDERLNDSHKLIIDVGLELSAKNILVVKRGARRNETKPRKSNFLYRHKPRLQHLYY